jgi:LmbE family N-acetylglucosaminyl deacetylase
VCPSDFTASSERDIVPFSASAPAGDRVVVLAPHPDDETLGCGGSLKILSKAGKRIKVVFLTKGEKAESDIIDREGYASSREKEALRAMKVLGISDYEFLRFPDRELYAHIGHAAEKVFAIVEGFSPDIIYSPSIIELNPDHRAAADIAVSLQKRYHTGIVFYEITAPVRPNMLVDITGVFGYKKKAIRVYKSQLKITDYLSLISSLNIYRTFTLGGKKRYAEAFLMVPNQSDMEKVGLWLGYHNVLSQNFNMTVLK